MCKSTLMIGMQLIVPLSFTPIAGLAAGISLDPGFGLDGRVTTDLYGAHDGAHAIVAQRQGEVVAAGLTAREWVHQAGLARYRRDGSLDTRFSRDGKVGREFARRFRHAEVSAVASQRDGKLVASYGNGKGYAGWSDTVEGEFLLSRHQQNGALDRKFGHHGKVITRVGNGSGEGCAVLVQRDGKILAGGTAMLNNPDTGNSSEDFALVRYKKDGRRDKTFGSGGIVATDFYYGDQLRAIALQSDRKIVAAGYAQDMLLGTVVALARYHPDGTLDGSFGYRGKVKTDIPHLIHANPFQFHCDPHDLVLQPDGKIVVGGPDTLARFNADGSLDESFGSGGKTPVPVAPHAIVLQPDGKLILAGSGKASSAFMDDFVLSRYNADGSPDLEFGDGGQFTTDFSGGSDQAYDLVLSGENRLVAVGTTYGGNIWNFDFALAGYLLE